MTLNILITSIIRMIGTVSFPDLKRDSWTGQTVYLLVKSSGSNTFLTLKYKNTIVGKCEHVTTVTLDDQDDEVSLFGGLMTKVVLPRATKVTLKNHNYTTFEVYKLTLDSSFTDDSCGVYDKSRKLYVEKDSGCSGYSELVEKTKNRLTKVAEGKCPNLRKLNVGYDEAIYFRRPDDEEDKVITKKIEGYNHYLLDPSWVKELKFRGRLSGRTIDFFSHLELDYLSLSIKSVIGKNKTKFQVDKLRLNRITSEVNNIVQLSTVQHLKFFDIADLKSAKLIFSKLVNCYHFIVPIKTLNLVESIIPDQVKVITIRINTYREIDSSLKFILARPDHIFELDLLHQEMVKSMMSKLPSNVNLISVRNKLLYTKDKDNYCFLLEVPKSNYLMDFRRRLPCFDNVYIEVNSVNGLTDFGTPINLGFPLS